MPQLRKSSLIFRAYVAAAPDATSRSLAGIRRPGCSSHDQKASITFCHAVRCEEVVSGLLDSSETTG